MHPHYLSIALPGRYRPPPTTELRHLPRRVFVGGGRGGSLCDATSVLISDGGTLVRTYLTTKLIDKVLEYLLDQLTC